MVKPSGDLEKNDQAVFFYMKDFNNWVYISYSENYSAFIVYLFDKTSNEQVIKFLKNQMSNEDFRKSLMLPDL